jgi:hypothetical protein|mmetsp:Transcript_15269/g.45799  ORF Transcript_15269/g.45799 Transcript_15269/m.45799 type:complete len:193 (-) Transcript_15269:110-688(-)
MASPRPEQTRGCSSITEGQSSFDRISRHGRKAERESIRKITKQPTFNMLNAASLVASLKVQEPKPPPSRGLSVSQALSRRGSDVGSGRRGSAAASPVPPRTSTSLRPLSLYDMTAEVVDEIHVHHHEGGQKHRWVLHGNLTPTKVKEGMRRPTLVSTHNDIKTLFQAVDEEVSKRDAPQDEPTLDVLRDGGS